MAELIIGDLVTASGRTIKFGNNTGIACPVCGKGDGPYLYIRDVIENTANIECKDCGYSECVPAEQVTEIRDIKGRLVNPPRR